MPFESGESTQDARPRAKWVILVICEVAQPGIGTFHDKQQ